IRFNVIGVDQCVTIVHNWSAIGL
nr:hypothetical protein [Tanacetum cinerariifolium]